MIRPMKQQVKAMYARNIPAGLYRAYSAKLKLLGRSIRQDVILHLRETVSDGVCEIRYRDTEPAESTTTLHVRNVPKSLSDLYRARLLVAERGIREDFVARMRDVVSGKSK